MKKILIVSLILFSTQFAQSGELKYVVDSIYEYDYDFRYYYNKHINYRNYRGLLVISERWGSNAPYVNPRNSLRDSITYKYDNNDSLVSKSYIHPAWSSDTQIHERWQYFRSESGILLGMEFCRSYSQNQSPEWIHEYKYDSLGRLEYQYEVNSGNPRKYEFFYNDLGNLSKKVLLNGSQWDDTYNNKYKWEYTYDTLNNQTNVETRKWSYNGTNMGWWEGWYKYEYFYNTNNLLTEKINYNWDNETYHWNRSDYKQAYIYDQNNYLIRRQDSTFNTYNNNWEVSGSKTDYFYSLIQTYNYDVVWDDSTYNPMTIEVQNALLDSVNLVAGDEIAIFDIDTQGNEVCVGVGAVQSQISPSNPLIITVSEDNPNTTKIDGFTDGNNIVFKLWNNANKKEYLNVTVTYNTSYDQVFTSSGNAIVNLVGHPHFEVAWSTPPINPMSIDIDSATINYNNFEIWDEIAIFDVDSIGNEICVGTGVVSNTISNNTPLVITVSEDDPATNEIDGFTAGNSIIYKAWCYQTNIQANIYQDTYNSSYDQVFTPLGNAKVSVAFTSDIFQTVNLSQGWNIMSFNVTPADTLLLDILQPLIYSNKLYKVLDEQGGFIQEIPGLGWINTIGEMNNTEGYHIKVLENSSLEVKGMALYSPYTIPLSAGWNLMGFPFITSMSAMEALNPIISDSIFMKSIDESGGIIQQIPGTGWVNTIGNLKPGDGYRTKVETDYQFSATTETPIVVTDSISSIKQNTATVYGKLTSCGGGKVLSKGICWSLTTEPTIFDSVIVDSEETEIIKCDINSLLPSTQYYVRTYSTSSVGTSYGNEINLTTAAPALPIIRTEQVTTITASTARSGGIIISNGGVPITARGVCWGTNYNPDLSDDYSTDGTDSGNFESALLGLSSNTRYYVRAYATNSVGTAYDDNWDSYNEFTSLDLPTVTTNNITTVTPISAVCGGVVTFDGNTIVVSGICWCTSSNPTINDSITVDGVGESSFSSIMGNLTHTTQYYVRAYATNSEGTCYGTEKIFISSAPTVPIVITDTVTYLSSPSAISGGDITSNGGLDITARGVCWSINSGPTLDDNFTIDSLGTGVFESEIINTTTNTTYYYKAYATNSTGTAYGNELSFTATAPCNDPVEYEGQYYSIVEIGTQCWMAENLNVGTRINGNVQQTDNDTIEKYCYNNVDDSCTSLGGFYQWNEIMEYETLEGRQGICPDGWHLPSNNEFEILEYYLGGYGAAGGNMKTSGTDLWHYPNTGANNSSGFSAIPAGTGGGYTYNGYTNYGYGGIYLGTYWWTSTLSGHPYMRGNNYNSSRLAMQTYPRTKGNSVRCIRD